MINKDYRLSFYIFTEIGIVKCQMANCSYSMKMDTDKYNRRTSRVVKNIRGTGGNKANRTIIFTLKSTEKGIKLTDKTNFENDNNMMAERHTYAAGPPENR